MNYIITFTDKPTIKLNNITSFLLLGSSTQITFKCGSTGVLLDVLSITMEESDSSNKQVFEYID